MKELRKTFYLIRYRINFTICNIVAIYYNLPFTQVVIYISCSCSRRITDRVYNLRHSLSSVAMFFPSLRFI